MCQSIRSEALAEGDTRSINSAGHHFKLSIFKRVIINRINMVSRNRTLGGKHIVYKIPSIRFIAHKLNVLDKAILSDDNKVFNTALDEIQTALIKVKGYKRFNTQYKNKPLLGQIRRKKYNWRKHLKSNKQSLPFKNIQHEEF